MDRNRSERGRALLRLGLIANGLKLVTTVLATAGDGDMELTRRDLHGLTLVMGALRSAVEHEQRRLAVEASA